jgi:(p)ppGpp synthase/HD superfamily hydrolase
MGSPSRRGYLLAGADAFARERYGSQRADDLLLFDHAIGVRRLLEEAGAKKSEILAAALLHHLPVSEGTRLGDVAARFGPRIARLVAEASDAEPAAGRDSIDQVATGSARGALLRVADRLHHLLHTRGPPAVRARRAAESL